MTNQTKARPQPKGALERQLEQLLEARDDATRRIHAKVAGDKPLSVDDQRAMGLLVERTRGLLKMLAPVVLEFDGTAFEGAFLRGMLSRVGSPLRGAESDELVFLRSWRASGHATFEPSAGLGAQLLLADSADARRPTATIPWPAASFRVQIPDTVEIAVPVEGHACRKLRSLSVLSWQVVRRMDQRLPELDMRPMIEAESIHGFVESAAGVAEQMRAVQAAVGELAIPAWTIRASDGRGIGTAVTLLMQEPTIEGVLEQLAARVDEVRPSVARAHLAMARLALHLPYWLAQKDRVGRPLWHAGMRSESRGVSLWRVGSGVKVTEAMRRDVELQFAVPEDYVVSIAPAPKAADSDSAS